MSSKDDFLYTTTARQTPRFWKSGSHKHQAKDKFRGARETPNVRYQDVVRGPFRALTSSDSPADPDLLRDRQQPSITAGGRPETFEPAPQPDTNIERGQA